MARSLGEFGAPAPEREPETFVYFGQTVRVHPEFTDLHLVDFMLRAGEIEEDDVAGGMAAVRDMLTHIVHPDDWPEFWATALRNRQMMQDLLGLVKWLVEGLSGHPTGRRSDSAAGRRKTGRKSKGDLPSRVIRRLERKGRPDLALIVADRRAHSA